MGLIGLTLFLFFLKSFFFLADPTPRDVALTSFNFYFIFFVRVNITTINIAALQFTSRAP